MLFIHEQKQVEIENEAKNSYPLECCGLLLGTNSSVKKVIEVRPVKNMNQDRTHDRFEIDSKDFAQIDREASKRRLQIVGIYHSHPDHPAVPSAFDTEHAWSGYSYIIVSVEKGNDVKVRSWVFDEKKKKFIEEEINNFG